MTKTQAIARLEAFRKRYDTNFFMMEKLADDPAKNKYVKIEERLNNENIALLKAAGLWINNPCPLSAAFTCERCTGWFRTKRYFNHNGKKCQKNVMAKVGKGRQCIYKDVGKKAKR